ncbi:hypothetical protein GYMC10_4705 [Paenibacillus sp. Y412MC10]|nr:hypothetical protein GYMC10_4705 [Paenibacillus sp. Y412MC10]
MGRKMGSGTILLTFPLPPKWYDIRKLISDAYTAEMSFLFFENFVFL